MKSKSWAADAIADLKEGKPVQIRPRGKSMTGRINDGALVTIEPADLYSIGEIVLATVKNKDYLHLITDFINNEFQIGNNFGKINGWVNKEFIFGKVIKVEL